MRNTHKNRALILASMVLAVGMSVPPDSEAAPPGGQLLASQCAQCHGTSGGEIAGEGDLYDELLEWKYATKGEKVDHIMHWQIKAFTDAQLLLIAEYFATLPSSGEDDDD